MAKISDEQARAEMIERGFRPDDDATYPGNGRHWPGQWIACGHRSTAIRGVLVSSDAGCRVCAGKQVLPGFNDLATSHPSLALEADGWDPTTVTAGSHAKRTWRCAKGHLWSAVVNTRKRGRGCPFCKGRKVLAGFNDLATLRPDIAAEACGWDPATVSVGTSRRLKWRCNEGHTWIASVANRTGLNTGCPYCAGQKIAPGFNDLATTHPELAREAEGWDPRTLTRGSTRKVLWRCQDGHTWTATVNDRTTSGNGCPVCSGRAAWPGLNDLASRFPDLAAQADGWDPKTLTAFSNKKVPWICDLGHKWTATVSSRSYGDGCPYCSGQRLLAGFNDLATLRPDIASEAHGWDPSTVRVGSGLKRSWRCHEGHVWEAAVYVRSKSGCPECYAEARFVEDSRARNEAVSAGFMPDEDAPYPGTRGRWAGTWIGCGHRGRATRSALIAGRGCPSCAERGFKPNQVGFVYLMGRVGEQQFGITGYPKDRIKKHRRAGWSLVEMTPPAPGDTVADVEARVKRWLKKNVGTLPGTTEAWSTADLEVASLRELFEKAGVQGFGD